MERLLRPKSIAVVGGGAWCRAVIAQNQKIGFEGPIWHVHPSAEGAFASVTDLPSVPDAVYVGVNRKATVQVIADLSAMGAGGAVCFASGFEEAEDGAALHTALLQAAGDMPILGPNCYGMLNALDGVALWPDQHGLSPVSSGVAIIAQSSNIAINLTMQRRGLPIAYVITPGNQAQQGIAQIAMEVLRDERVTALGLYIEGFADVRAFEALAELSAKLCKPIVALKAGQSEESQRATLTHTASIAGSAIGAKLLLDRLRIASVPSLPVMLETLKVFHCFGHLPGPSIATLSCSGGEASVIADTATRHNLAFAPMDDSQRAALAPHLGHLVTLANPLDYHTDIWRDQPAMTAVFSAMAAGQADLTIVILDFPRLDTCDAADWMITIAAIEDAAAMGGRFAVLASMPENMPEDVAVRLLASGIVPLVDFDHACMAIRAAAMSPVAPLPNGPVVLPAKLTDTRTLTEGEAKAILADIGLDIPRHIAGIARDDLAAQAHALGFPVVLKAEGIAHKSDEGGVALGLPDVPAVLAAADAMLCDCFLIEEMVTDPVVELLVGVVADPAHGFVLTIAAGGILTEVLRDSQSLLVPADAEAVSHALSSLRVAQLLRGYRGKPGSNLPSIVQAIMALQDYVVANADNLAEIEINPLICTPHRAVVADALLVRGKS